MIHKTQQTQSQINKIQVINKSKNNNLTILINNLTKITDIQMKQKLLTNLNTKSLHKKIIETYKNTHKQLKQSIHQNININSLKDLLK